VNSVIQTNQSVGKKCSGPIRPTDRIFNLVSFSSQIAFGENRWSYQKILDDSCLSQWTCFYLFSAGSLLAVHATVIGTTLQSIDTKQLLFYFL